MAYRPSPPSQGAYGQPPPPPPSAPPASPYVFFERTPAGFKKDTLEKAQAAKLKLEHFYQKAVQEAIERNGRSVAWSPSP